MSEDRPTTRQAVIDVGTNSVKLLVADIGEHGTTPVLETSKQTRLGRGFYDTHTLQPEAIRATAQAVGEFARRAKGLGAVNTRPFATSAARDAQNAQALVQAIRQLSGLELTIISGETEAEWAFRGAAENPALDGRFFLLIDVGGGSTEFILGREGHRHFSRSFPLGTVRTIEALPHADPPTAEQLAHCRQTIAAFLREAVDPHLRPALRELENEAEESPQLAGTGGTASILAAMEARLTVFDRNQIESVQLTHTCVSSWAEQLWQMPMQQRQQLPGLPPARADVILAGVVIFEGVMKQFGFRELRVSTRGLRFAALRALAPGTPGPSAHSQ